MSKSATDIHWNERALGEADDTRVNIGDTVQRDIELDFVFAEVPNGRVLEVGCGNGYVSQQLRARVAHLDAFDYAENMIERARRSYGERNNRFFHASVLDPAAASAGGYDAVVCVRVLINLRNLDEQRRAVENMASWLKPGGKLILVEGYREGFDALDRLRRDADLPPLTAAKINFYSRLDELMPELEGRFTVAAQFHTGMFDFLTRVVYPRLAGPDQVREAGDFHRKIEVLAKRFNPDDLRPLARVRGFALVKR